MTVKQSEMFSWRNQLCAKAAARSLLLPPPYSGLLNHCADLSPPAGETVTILLLINNSFIYPCIYWVIYGLQTACSLYMGVYFFYFLLHSLKTSVYVIISLRQRGKAETPPAKR